MVLPVPSGSTACGIGLATNYLYCWGSNDAGGLGLGINAGFTNVPTLVG
jgi:alpha-tubulin suppressor-like RCC1 family protein